LESENGGPYRGGEGRKEREGSLNIASFEIIHLYPQRKKKEVRDGGISRLSGKREVERGAGSQPISLRGGL